MWWSGVQCLRAEECRVSLRQRAMGHKSFCLLAFWGCVVVATYSSPKADACVKDVKAEV